MGCTKSTPSSPKAGDAPSAGNEIEFGYWGIKGFGETCRWIGLYLQLNLKEWNPQSPEEWGKKKQTKGPFPNLPYIQDGDFFLSESSAIPVYLIKKAGKTELLGKDLKDIVRLRMIQGVLDDVKSGFLKVVFGGDDKAGALSKILAEGGETAAKIQSLSSFLAEKSFFLGYLSLVDFDFVYLATLLGAIAMSMEVACPFSKHANLRALMARVKNLPGIRERVMNSKQTPFMPPGMFPVPLLTSAQIEEKFPCSGDCSSWSIGSAVCVQKNGEKHFGICVGGKIVTVRQSREKKDAAEVCMEDRFGDFWILGCLAEKGSQAFADAANRHLEEYLKNKTGEPWTSGTELSKKFAEKCVGKSIN